MNRRLFLSLGLAAVCFGQAAFARSFADSVVAQLKKRGYRNISVGRTLLGRTRITAERNGGRREIILNPRTGEILRDLWIKASDSTGADDTGLIDTSSTTDDDGQPNTNTDDHEKEDKGDKDGDHGGDDDHD
ncbi:MAG: hypothetical protein ACK4RZ_12675 [Paracoccaceae bacterium]